MFVTDLPRPATGPATALDAFRSIGWLAAVAPSTIERLAAQAMVMRMPRGAQIFDQAEIPTFAQFLLAGSIELLAVRGEEETLVELLRPVDALLPAAVLGALPYLVRARVRDDAVMLLVPAEAFRAAVAADHALCLAVLACQATQFRRQMKLAKAIRLRSAEERVGAFLLALAKARPGANEIRLPIEKRQIASQLGMTRETLSRVLPVLAPHGLRVAGDRLFVDDLAAARTAFPYDPLIDGRDEITPLAAPGGLQ
ncbi:helix-turn-helix domain-containing protein [Sphingomonas sp. LB-2]|uniref:helix-turn-helix domain-containing protein n=1 Tax=Sphingomonas caeni TaxID=2984949 RepID=UPI0022327E09|nr:helix-turn-helix domain-containing protein [Sphingomonas caeni]MCW3845995.1 helix-turn-helix domain-containing protein [Sphingomonas caeni]